MPLREQLDRWTAAGLIAAEQASRIRAYETARSVAASAERRGFRGVGRAQAEPSTADRGDVAPLQEITATEVVAYLGAIVVLVGISFLVATQYQQLGAAGRDVIFALVAAAGLGCGFLMDGRSDRPAARRARAAGYFLGSIAFFALVSQVFVDARLLTTTYHYSSFYTSDNPAGDILAGAVAAAVLAAGLLWRARAGLLAFAFSGFVYTAIGAFESWQAPPQPDPWLGLLPYLLGAALLVAFSELLVRRNSAGWAVEVLRFMAVLAPVTSALGFSYLIGVPFEGLAGALALGALAAAMVRKSGGYVISGGLGLFSVVMEVGFRHFAQTLGYPVLLIASGLLLLAIAIAMVRVLPRLRGSGGSSHLGGDGVDLGQEHG